MMSSRGPSKSEAANHISPRQEGLGASDEASKTVGSSVSGASFASTPWFRLKDPRVVRVSRAFGGKDRHSKVFTIRGLRDRRVRLSVPTAIQLYDLQDRLGLIQPSKVVDWLLDAAKHEIDELPPLPLQPVHLGHPQFFHQYSSSPSNVSSSAGTNQNRSSYKEIGMVDGLRLDGGNSLCNSSTRHKFVHSLESSCQNKANGDCEDEENQERIMRNDQEEVSEGIQDRIAEGLMQRGNFSSRANHGYNMPYGSNVSHLDPSEIASFPHHRQITSQASSENSQSLNIHRHIPSAISISHTLPYFPVQFITSSRSDMDPPQVSHLQPTFMTNSDLQNFLPSFHELPLNSQGHHQPSSVRFPFMSFDVNTTAAPSQSSSENDMDKEQLRSQHSPLIKH